MKDLMENWRGYLAEQKGIETFEDLKKLLRTIEAKRKGGVVGKKALDIGITKGAGVLIREGNISSKFYEKIGEPYQVHEYKMLQKDL